MKALFLHATKLNNTYYPAAIHFNNMVLPSTTSSSGIFCIYGPNDFVSSEKVDDIILAPGFYSTFSSAVTSLWVNTRG
jgi:hypothetical protein